MLGTASQVADRYVAQTRARDNGAHDASQGRPATNESSLSPTEQRIVLLAQQDADESAATWRDEVASHEGSFRSQIAQLPLNFPRTIADFQAECALAISGHDADLVKHYEEKEKRAIEYRHFKAENNLQRDAHPKTPPIYYLAWLVVAAMLESVVNGVFFKDAMEGGLVQGVALAMLISVINACLGFFTGAFPCRYMFHRYRAHILWSVPLALVLATIVIVFNLLVGHLRDAMSSLPPGQPVSIKTADILTPFLKGYLSLSTIESWLLFLVGSAIALYAGWKGYTLFDPYPGFGQVLKRLEEADEEYRTHAKLLKEPLDEKARESLALVQKEHVALAGWIKVADEALSGLDAANSTLASSLSVIDKAANAALGVYRSANLEVRDPMLVPPPYFNYRWPSRDPAREALDRERAAKQTVHENMRKELGERETRLKEQYEHLVKRMPEIIANFLSGDAIRARRERAIQEAKDTIARERVEQETARAQHGARGADFRTPTGAAT